MTRITRDQYMIFLDVLKGGTGAPSWKRIGKSTIFEYTLGEVEEEKNFIDQPGATTDITGYNAELPEEIITERGDAIHDFIEQEFKGLPIGSACEVPCLICFPPTAGGVLNAHHAKATLTSKVLNPVDQKYTFTIKLGMPTLGTYTISSGVPTWVPPSTAGVGNKKVGK